MTMNMSGMIMFWALRKSSARTPEDHGQGQGDENGQEDGQAEDDVAGRVEVQAELAHHRGAAGLDAGLAASSPMPPKKPLKPNM